MMRLGVYLTILTNMDKIWQFHETHASFSRPSHYTGAAVAEDLSARRHA